MAPIPAVLATVPHILSPIANVFAAVGPVFGPVPAILDPIAPPPVVQPIAAVLPTIPNVLGPVPPVLGAVADVFPAVANVFHPIAGAVPRRAGVGQLRQVDGKNEQGAEGGQGQHAGFSVVWGSWDPGFASSIRPDAHRPPALSR